MAGKRIVAGITIEGVVCMELVTIEGAASGVTRLKLRRDQLDVHRLQVLK